MKTKDNLLYLLEQHRGQTLSGEQIAQALGVSRAAIWKVVSGLRDEGLAIESVPGSGYRLPAESDWLCEAALLPYLRHDVPVQVLAEVDSTNLAAKRWAMDGAPHGAMVVAQRQTAGRGRLGRSFASPPGGLYLSIVLRPPQGQQAAVLITAAASVAVCEAVFALCGLELSIKWVNDLFYRGKKCCGILTEAATNMENGHMEYMVVGIGVNYTTPHDALGEAAKVATALFPGGAGPVTRGQLAAEIHHRLLDSFEKLEQREFLEKYREKSMVLNNMVTVHDRCPYTAYAMEIDDEARLVVRKDNGKTAILSYGEISITV